MGSNRNPAPFPKAFPDFNGIGGGLVLFEQQVHLVNVVPGGLVGGAVDGDTVPHLVLHHHPYNWTGDTIADILERPEYQGHTVNFKTYKQSYKSKKTCYNAEEKWLVFENTHEAIIDADTWARVQELRKNKRRPTRTGKTNMFSGIVRCADCGEKLYYCTNKNFEARQDHFVCSTSRLKGKEICKGIGGEAAATDASRTPDRRT